MNRTQARRLWQRVADGALNFAATDVHASVLHDQVKAIAAAILKADREKSAQRRPLAIARATGLTGKLDPHAELRAYLSAVCDFDSCDEEGNPVKLPRGALMRSMIAAARSKGWIADEASDPEARKVIERIVRELKT